MYLIVSILPIYIVPQVGKVLIDDKYIFVYTLGGFKREVKEKICKCGEDLGLRVIDIMDIDDIDSDYYIHTRPDEFLYWINNARLVVTDSFHASVFSILFNRPFVVTERSDIKGMGSRLDTLFNKFGISGRYFDELKDGFEVAGEVCDKLFKADYFDVPVVLEDERKKAGEFYRKCLDEKNSDQIQKECEKRYVYILFQRRKCADTCIAYEITRNKKGYCQPRNL